MNIYHKNLLAAIFGMLPFLSIAQWTPLPIPVGSYIYRDLTVHKQAAYTTVYKNFQIRLARTTDKIHWELAASLSTNLQTVGLTHCFSGGNRLFVTGKNNQSHISHAFASDNNTANWTQLSWPNQAQTDFFAAWDSTFLVINDGTEILRSGNSGANWQSVHQTSGKVYDLKRIGDKAWLATTETKIYRSTDDGVTWEETPAPYDATGLGYAQLSIFPTEIGAFVKIYNDTTSTIYRTVDQGNSWSVLPLPTNNNYYNVWDMVFLNGKLFITDGGLMSSADEGQSWYRHGTPNTLDVEKDGNTLCIGGSDGFFKSFDAGETWWTGNVGWETALGQVSSPFFHPDQIHYHQGKLYLFSYGENYVSGNEGQEWRFFSGKNFAVYKHFVGRGDSILLLGNGLMRSFDNGNTWDQIPGSSDTYHPLSGNFDFTATNDQLFAYSWISDTIYRSSDWGLHWTSIPLPNNIFFLDYAAGTNNALYITDASDIYVSYNNGQSFSLANSGIGNNAFIEGLWAAENIPLSLAEGALFRRQNNLWKPATTGLYDDQGNLPFIQDIRGDDGRLLIVGAKELSSEPLLFLSDDSGQSWSSGWELGLPPIEYAFAATLNGNTIYAVGEIANTSLDLGLWKRDASVGVQDLGGVGQIACSISPNPANESSQLVFEKVLDETCSIRVFDALGCLQWTGSAVEQQLEIPTAHWPSGIYEVVVRGENGGVATRKLVVQH